jgi:hypothetical protein
LIICVWLVRNNSGVLKGLEVEDIQVAIVLGLETTNAVLTLEVVVLELEIIVLGLEVLEVAQDAG